MQAWVTPAFVAAIISLLITAVGWQVSYRNALGIEKERRREKVRDFQIALRAEIRSELHHLQEVNFDANLKIIQERYAASKTYSVFVPNLGRHAVFESLVKDIPVLPETVIDPLILYTRQRQILDNFATDMRSERFSKIAQDRQLEMYHDYINATEYLRLLATKAVAAIDAAMANGEN